MIYSDNTYDITSNIATYTRRDFKSVFDTTSNKWYMLNNLNNYEEYGIYGDSFDTYYQGKLVIVNGHEYEWNGTEWVDLGEYVEQVVSIYRDSSHTGNIRFPQYIRNMSSFSATFKFIQSGGGVFLGSNCSSDSNDWRTFFHKSEIYYDCGDERTNNGQIKINNKYNLLFSGNPMKLTNITTGAVIYTGSTTRPSSGDYNFCFGSVDEYGSGGGSSTDYDYLYDLVFYSDNNGQNAIAHYIPYIQNGTVGMFDTINDVFVAANGTLGVESRRVRPKDYIEKPTPTISTLYASTIYRNSAHLTTLMRNDAEMAKIDYMSDDILMKGEVPPQIDYLCFEAIEAGTIKFEAPNGFSQYLGEPNLEYSFDKATWTTLHVNNTVSLQANDKIYFRGENPNGFTYGRGADRNGTTNYLNCLLFTNRYNISGNIMTLIDKIGLATTIPNAYCFSNLFCTELTTLGAKNGKVVSAINLKLPATTLQYDCYRNLFNGNQIMTTPPKILPAMTLTDFCYANIFLGCVSLLEGPILPAKVLTNYCYNNLFFDCSSLKKIVCYATSGINSTNTKDWVKLVSSTGDFYKDANTSWPSGVNGIPSGWTVHTSL